MSDSVPTPTPIVHRLSEVNIGEKLYPMVHEHWQYSNMVGGLLYLACWPRPDLAFAVSKLYRFVSSPGQNHMKAVKHLLLYLEGTQDLDLKLAKPKNTGPMDRPNVLWGFVDSDWAGCPDSHRSPFGYALMLDGAAISWNHLLNHRRRGNELSFCTGQCNDRLTLRSLHSLSLNLRCPVQKLSSLQRLLWFRTRSLHETR